MKKVLLSAALLFTALTSPATILTVSQDAPLPGQYTNINTAIGAATPGDTIYVHATSTW